MAKRKKQGDSGYEKQEVREAFMDSYRYKPCEVCRTTYKTCGHHAIPQGRCIFRCVSPENIVVLCQKHHNMGNEMAAHSTSMLVVDRFNEWMKQNKPEQWAWAKEHQYDTGKMRWKQMYEVLKSDGIEAVKERINEWLEEDAK